MVRVIFCGVSSVFWPGVLVGCGCVDFFRLLSATILGLVRDEAEALPTAKFSYLSVAAQLVGISLCCCAHETPSSLISSCVCPGFYLVSKF